MIAKERLQQDNDNHLRLLKDKRNELESYIFNTREHLNSDLKEYLEEQDKENLTYLMKMIEEWLYSGQSELEDLDEIAKREYALRFLGDKAYNRQMRWTTVLDNLHKLELFTIRESERAGQQYMLNKEGKKSILSEDDFAKLTSIIDKAKGSLNDFLQLVKKSSKLSDPSVSFLDVQEYLENAEGVIKSIYKAAKKRSKEQLHEGEDCNKGKILEENDSSFEKKNESGIYSIS